MVKMKFLPHFKGLQAPQYQSAGASGIDLPAAIAEGIAIKIEPGERVVIPTGISIAMPSTMEAQCRSRSGLAAQHGVMVLNSPGTVDCDYRGELRVILMNLGGREFFVERGDRIAQLVFMPVCRPNINIVDELDDTERGDGGFGSTGVQ